MEKPLLSIACITYNHENYIEKTIASFMKQQIDFTLEIIIHDDASTDKTPQIVQNYANEYPELIYPILQTQNQYSKGKKPLVDFVFPRASGKYIALCEGDDYWSDPLKLQKQVTFLETHPDYVICYHDAVIIDDNDRILQSSKLHDDLKRDFSNDDLIKGIMVLTLSMCFRNLLHDFPYELGHVRNGDKFLTSLLGNFGKGKYMPDIAPAVYRKHSGAVWSSLDETKQIYHNAVTRVWLHRYYKRIEKGIYADYFRNEAQNLFTMSLTSAASLAGHHHDTLADDILKNYSDILNGPDDIRLLEFSKRVHNQDHITSNKQKLMRPLIKKSLAEQSAIDLDEHTNGKKVNVISEQQNIYQIIQSKPSRELQDTININWVLTRKCNYKCTYCTVKDNENGFFHDIADLKFAIDKLCFRNKQHIKFIITGGEPTIYPYYVDFLEYIFHSLGTCAEVATITNLSMPRSFLEKLGKCLSHYLDKISFIASFHFEFAHKEIFIENVKYLSRNGISVRTQILADPEYMHPTKELYDDLTKICNEKSQVDIKVVREKFGPNPDKRYTAADLEWLKKFYNEYENDELKIDLLTNDHRIDSRKSSANELITYNWNSFKGYECYAGIESISINANGDIDPAICFRGIGGRKANIFKDKHPIADFQKPVICPFDKCGCLADLLLTKKHPDYDHLITLPSYSFNTSFEYWLNSKGWLNKKGLYTDCFESVTFQNKIDEPKISIIVISWRLHPDNLTNFQILQKQRDQNFELIFVNNGAVEGEFDPLNPYIDTYVRLNSNTGAYLARNIGALFAKAPLLLFLEDDGIPNQNLIKAHLDLYQKYEIIACRGLYVPKTNNPLNKLAGHYYLGPKPFPIFADIEGNTSYLADAFFRASGWDDEILFGGGGLDMSRRLLQIDPDQRKQIYSPLPILYHDYAVNNKHLKSKTEKQKKSRERLKAKHPDYDIFINSWNPFYQRDDLLIKKKTNDLTTYTPNDNSSIKSQYDYPRMSTYFIEERLASIKNDQVPQTISSPNNQAIQLQKSPQEIYQHIQQSITNKIPSEVIRDLKMLIESFPEFSMAYNDLGVLYHRVGDNKNARRYYETAVQLDPVNMVSQKNLADFYFLEMNRVEDALRIYVKILEKNPEDVETLLNTGYICVSLNKFEDAKVFYQRVLELDPWNENAKNIKYKLNEACLAKH